MSESTDKKLTPTQTKAVIKAVYAAVALCDTAVFLYLTMMPYTFKLYGIDNRTYGYIQSAYAFLQMCSSPLTGQIADLFGAKTVLIINALSCASAHVLMGATRGVPLLIASRVASVLHGMVPGAQMLLTNIVEKSERASALGKVMIPSSVGIVFGPLVGGAMSSRIGQQNTLLVSWIFPAIAGLLVLTQIPTVTMARDTSADNKVKKSAGFGRMVKLCTTGKVPIYITVRLLTALPGMIIQMSFPLIAMETFGLKAHQNGLILSYCGMVGIFVNGYLVGRLSKSFESSYLIKASCILSVISYALMSQCKDVFFFCGTLFPWMVAFMVLENQVITAATKCVPESDTGTIVGVSTGAFHLARTMAPLIGGVLIETIGFPGFGYVGLLSGLFMSALCFLSL